MVFNATVEEGLNHNESRNPCFNGIWFLMTNVEKLQKFVAVAILVLMEYGF